MFLKLLLISFTVLFISCDNSYENQILGTYAIKEFKSDTNYSIKKSKLVLSKNNKFVFFYDTVKFEGTWHAGRSEQSDWINFNWERNGKEQYTEGMIIGKNFNTVYLNNPGKFISKDIQKITYIRIEN